jgi:hypothetical protein
MEKYKLIGITGRKFNGKDTVGNYLINKYNYKNIAFAGALKKACQEIFGFTDEQVYGNEKEIIDEFWKTTPRKILQYIGTDLFRNQLKNIIPDIGEDIWIQVVKRKIIDIWKENPEQRIVITDVRFQNEVNIIEELGGIIIKVSRPSINSNIDIHESELQIDNLKISSNIHILNDSSLEDLYDKINYIITNSSFFV